MLAPDKSPIHQLVFPWWQAERRPSPFQAQEMREALFAAALHEIGAHIAANTSYDPLGDHRFLWASQYLQLAEGDRRSIDKNVAATAALILNPSPKPSRQHLAAGEREMMNVE